MSFANGLIDLRSDTVTHPTPEMRAAMSRAEVGDDVFGDDPTVNALEARDLYTRQHSSRVTEIALVLGRELGCSTEELTVLNFAGPLHDIGKIGIRDAVLLKPGPLDDTEWQHMREHPVKGFDIASKIEMLRPIMPAVRSHHERWDGTGYPLGLAGPAIPLGARIFAVADAFDALTFDRPYSTAMPMVAARERIRAAAGTHFDPDVVATFLAMPLDVFETARVRSLDRPTA